MIACDIGPADHWPHGQRPAALVEAHERCGDARAVGVALVEEYSKLHHLRGSIEVRGVEYQVSSRPGELRVEERLGTDVEVLTAGAKRVRRVRLYLPV